MTIAERIRARREEIGLTAAQLAKEVSVSPAAITNIETGRRAPSPQLAMRLNRVLGIRITLPELAIAAKERQVKTPEHA